MCIVLQGVNASSSVPITIRQYGLLSASTTVAVTNNYVCMTKISLVAFTGATWLQPAASLPLYAPSTAGLAVLQVTVIV